VSPQSCAQASRPRRFAAIATTIAGMLALAVAPVRVAAAAPDPASASAPVEAAVPVMILLDASGSMNQADAPGPRIDAAKTAVTDLLGTLPADTQVGLMVYGTGTGSTDAEKTAGCQDIKTLSPVGSLDVPALTAQVNAVTASGYTPVGNALRAAADALPNEGPRSIVLVSDGEDTCAPPAPCDVARDLDQQGIDLTVHTVGFKVDPTARDQLSCIAQATGGTYSDADDATQLSRAMATKVDYAITGYTTAGTPVTGADQASEQAPLLTPGQYVDTFAVGGSGDAASTGTRKYYTIAVREGMRPYISATVVPPDDNAGGVDILGIDLDLMRRDLRSCHNDRGFEVVVRGQIQAATAVLDGPTFGGPQSSTCPTDGVAILRVARIGKAWADRPLQVEIVVRMEPPADASGLLPQASEGDVLPAPTHVTPTALTGGSSFNDAPRLVSGTTHSDTLVTGESRYYRVPLQWGQRLTYLVTEVGPAQPELGPIGSNVWVDAFNPVREKVTRLSDTSAKAWFANSANDDPFTSSTVYPVRYTNRNGVDQRDYSLDGDYYLRISADRNEDEPSSTTFLVTVVMSGAVENGPVYLEPGAVPDDTTGATPPSTAGATSSSTSSPVTAGSSIATGQGTPVSGSPVSGWVWVVLAVLAAGGVAAFLLVRTRGRE
jgi:Ca-activated chloride channel family protein